MKRVVFGIACLSASFLVAMGCSSESNSTEAPKDSAAPVDSAKPVVVVDSGPAAPACYSIPKDTNGNEVDVDTLISALTNPAAYDYHASLAPASGCSAADVTALVAAVEAKNNAAGATATARFQFQNDVAGLDGVSTTCKSCVSAEYATAKGPTTKWGVSGARHTAARAFELPGNAFGANLFGCAQASGAVTEAQARASYRAALCTSFACGGCGQDAAARNECLAFALSKDGICESFDADAKAADSALKAALAAGGTCDGLDKIVTVFCGAGAVATDAGTSDAAAAQ